MARRSRKPERTRISLVHEPAGLSITYGVRLGFWVMLAISLSGALLASSALRAEDAPEWAGPASAWVRTLPPVPRRRRIRGRVRPCHG